MQNKIIITLFISLTFFIQIKSSESKINSTVLYKIAVKKAQAGNDENAIIAFKNVIKVNPYYSPGHYGLGRVYLYNKGMLNEAVKHLQLSVTYDRRLSMGYFYLGMAYMLKKKYSQSIHAFTSAYKYNNDLIEALYNIGVIYETINVNHKSSQFYENYLKRKKQKEEDYPF